MPDTRHWPVLETKVVGSVKLEVEHFLECVLHDAAPCVTGEDGRQSLEVMLAAERSILAGQKIDLPLDDS